MENGRPELAASNRSILIWMCILITVNQLGFSAVVPVVALYAEAFGVSNAAIGMTIAIYGLSRLLVNIPAGNVADRFGRKHALAIGGLLTAIGATACAVAPTYELFLVARFVAGAGAAFVLTGGQIVLADITTRATRGRVMSIYQGVFLVTAGAGAWPGGWLATRLGLDAPFWANAILALLLTVIAWMCVPETRHMADVQSEAESSGDPLNFRQQLGTLIRSRNLALISAIGLVAAFARTGGMFNLIPLIAENQIGLTTDQIGLGIGMISILSLVFVYPSGWMVDRFGRKAVIVPTTMMSGGAMLLFIAAADFSSFVLACAAWAAATGIAGAAPGAYAADVAPRGMNASAMSLYRALSDIGYVIGPLTMGLIADVWGSDSALQATSGLIIAVGVLFALRATETRIPRPA